MNILITGIAGCGKTTIIAELSKKGHQAIDLDTCGVCLWVNKKSGKETTYKEGAGRKWIEEHRWQVVIPKLTKLLNKLPPHQDVFVGGKIARSQIKEMLNIFDVILLLNPNNKTIHQRLSSRTCNINNFARTKAERETVTANRQQFEQACLDNGAIPLNNHGSLNMIIKEILDTAKHQAGEGLNKLKKY
jgi:broad-specificity NMP kinase